ncbi:hypothetical protein CLU79DRAFT_769517 [Phycomyces nitens]|nr:hypothetical protein CLU79DRAFT_769517 [Phycomyces nitens]
MYPRSQAACKVLGVPMTEENGQNCLAKLERGDLEVIYVEEVGHRQPFAVGKQTIVQDPVYFRKYIDGKLTKRFVFNF